MYSAFGIDHGDLVSKTAKGFKVLQAAKSGKMGTQYGHMESAGGQAGATDAQRWVYEKARRVRSGNSVKRAIRTQKTKGVSPEKSQAAGYDAADALDRGRTASTRMRGILPGGAGQLPKGNAAEKTAAYRRAKGLMRPPATIHPGPSPFNSLSRARKGTSRRVEPEGAALGV